jgi:putative transposase
MRSFRHRQWYLDEVFVKINGVKHDLWRAVDHEGEVLESFVTKRRDKNEVDRQNMNIGHGLLLDRATMALDGNIRCRPEGHPPHQFTSARHLKRLVSIDDEVANLHNLPRHAMSSSDDRALRAEAMVAWRQIAEPGIATQRQGVNRCPRREPIAFLG